jgi:hypothetical protein
MGGNGAIQPRQRSTVSCQAVHQCLTHSCAQELLVTTPTEKFIANDFHPFSQRSDPDSVTYKYFIIL